MLLLLLPGGYNRPAVQIPGSPFDEAASSVALPYDERSSAKSTRRKNACAMHTTPGGAKKIMLLRRMQVAIRIARSWDALSGFGQPTSCKQPGIFLPSAVKSLLGIRRGVPGSESSPAPSQQYTGRPGPSPL